MEGSESPVGLGYRPWSERPRGLGWRTARVALILAPVFGLIALTFVSLKRTESWMDAVTGSTTRQTYWPFGITSGPTYAVSPIEARLRRMGVAWTPNWKFLHNTHYTIFGSATCYECGNAPPILQLRTVAQSYVAVASDAEVREFARVMQSGTDEEQRLAVDAAGERAMGRVWGK